MTRVPTAERGERRRVVERPGWAADPATARLFEVIAGRARGRTLVVGGATPALHESLRRRGLESVALDVDVAEKVRSVLPGDAAQLAAKRFGTVVLIGVLERLEAVGGDRLTARASEWLKPGGRLLVAVPNEDCVAVTGQVRVFDRRTLKKLLRPLGSFRLVSEQPFKWLLAEVRKSRGRRSCANSAREERYRVTAELCRGRVIELGCGWGELAGQIRERGLDVTGVDLNAAKIEAARERYPDIRFIQSDIRELDLPDAEFDTAVLAEVLEHLPEGPGGEALEQAARLLKPGGRLIVSVPNEDSIPHPNHVRSFDRRSLAELLRPWGAPQLVSDQPFKWLMMYVEKDS